MNRTRISPPPGSTPRLRGLARRRSVPRPTKWHGDLAALTALLAIILVTVGFRFVYDNWLAQFDILNFFLPNYSYVGRRIHAGQLPAWNPYFSSGTPMAGDASGGWMYLPVMIAFALFSSATAMKVMVLLQTLVGGLATYLFGRRLAFDPPAALIAATALAVGPALYDATSQSTVIGQVSAWLPLGMAGAEGAIQAARWSSRLAWAGVTGVALVQMFAAWPQGFMYGAMLVGAWFIYRGVIGANGATVRRLAWFGRALIAGSASMVFAAALGAAAILPRLDFIAQSTIQEGNYANLPGSQYAATTFSWLELLGVYLQDSLFWRIIEFNSVIVLLAILAVLLRPRWYGTPFFVVAILLFIDLAADHSLTRRWFYLLPIFETIHSHRPTATMYMVYLPLAMLAGAGAQALLCAAPARRAWLRRLLPLPILLLAMAMVKHSGASVSVTQIGLAIAATVLIVAAGCPFPRWGRPVWTRALGATVLALLALSLVYPSGVDFVRVVRYPSNDKNNLLSANASIAQQVQTVLARHDPDTAAGLLQYLQSTRPPFRYAAYFGTGAPGNHDVPSSWLSREPDIMAILANSRSAQLELEQISGYNPLHLRAYAEYVTAMNGVRQNYHWLDVYYRALADSQLLDMLNVRYVLVPANLRFPPPIADYGKVIYRDELVVVYENPRAFPRAWIVHEVRPDHDGRGLALLASGKVDGHLVSFVSGTDAAEAIQPPPGGPRPHPRTSADHDRVEVTDFQPERIAMRTTSGTHGFLVVSEPYANGWKAYVDGKQVADVRTDHALQGVSLPAGNHTVVLTYEPLSLAIGLPVTGGATAVLLGIWDWAWIDWRRSGSRRRRRTSG